MPGAVLSTLHILTHSFSHSYKYCHYPQFPQIRKSRLRKVRQLAQGYTACEWQSQGLNPTDPKLSINTLHCYEG